MVGAVAKVKNAFFQGLGLCLQKWFQIVCRSLHLLKTDALVGALRSSQIAERNKLVLGSLVLGLSNFSFPWVEGMGSWWAPFLYRILEGYPRWPLYYACWLSWSCCTDRLLPLVLQVSEAAPLACPLSQRFASPLRRMIWRWNCLHLQVPASSFQFPVSNESFLPVWGPGVVLTHRPEPVLEYPRIPALSGFCIVLLLPHCSLIWKSSHFTF